MELDDQSPVPKGSEASDADRTALEGWLGRRFGAPVRITDLRRPEGAGHSNETWMLTTTGAGPAELVVRPQPTVAGVFPEYALDTQVRCMEALRSNTDLPAPVVVGYEQDAAVLGRPFYVMERIDGVIPPDYPPYTLDGWFLETPAADQTRLYESSIDTLAALHRLDPFATGFGFLVPEALAGAGETACLRHHVDYWRRYLLEFVDGGADHPVLAPALAHLDATIPVTDEPARLTWGDARISNMIFRDFRPVAVIDWEMAALGPPEVDLAWYLWLEAFFAEGIGFPYLPGYPGKDGIVARYEAAAGRAVRDLPWFEAFAGLRYGAILARIAAMRAGTGELSAEDAATAARNNPCTRALAALLGLPRPGEPGGPFG